MVQSFLSDPERYLQWVQPAAMQRRFELRDGDHVFATLEFQSAFGSLAVGTSNEGSWTFKRVGFFNPRVTVRQAGSESDLAVYHPRWTGTQGQLEFADGRSFTWRVTNFWATRFALLDAAGSEVVLYRSGKDDSRLTDILKLQARLSFGPAARGLAHPTLFALLSWYLLVLHHEDSAAAAT